MVNQHLKQLTTYLTFATLFLALTVIVLGSYTRLADAGLGCPDWPGCYGKIGVPNTHQEISLANEAYPERPVDPSKAWPEMIHRYFATTLGFLCLLICILSLLNRKHPAQPAKLSTFILLLVILQGMMGMWTVTLKLYPPVVLGHLLGGFTIFTLLLLMSLRSSQVLQPIKDTNIDKLKPYALIGIILLVIQIGLGGWTAANYSALSCTQLPICQGNWQNHLNFSEAFKLWHANDQDFEFAPHLSDTAQMTIHVTHRIGAIIVSFYIALLCIVMYFKASVDRYRYFALGILSLLVIQILLGISNVKLSLPLPVAVAHNLGGALLLGALVSLFYSIRKKQ